MSIETVAIRYSSADQIARGGYALGALVLRDGVIWVSLIASNLTPPGGDGLVSWMLFA